MNNGYKKCDINNKSEEQKKILWDNVIGMQAVDGLNVSDYLKSLVNDNIAGRRTVGVTNDNLIFNQYSFNFNYK